MCESDGLCRVGWATRAAAYEIGKDRRSFGYGSTGKKSHGGSFDDYGTSFGKVALAGHISNCMHLYGGSEPTIYGLLQGDGEHMYGVLGQGSPCQMYASQRTSV